MLPSRVSGLAQCCSLKGCHACTPQILGRTDLLHWQKEPFNQPFICKESLLFWVVKTQHTASLQYHLLPRGTVPVQEPARQQEGGAGQRGAAQHRLCGRGQWWLPGCHLSCLWQGTSWEGDSEEESSGEAVCDLRCGGKGAVWVMQPGWQGPLETIQSRSPAQSRVSQSRMPRARFRTFNSESEFGSLEWEVWHSTAYARLVLRGSELCGMMF